MLDHESVSFPSYVFDVAALMISYDAIFHLKLSPMSEFLLHLEGSLVSPPLFHSPDDIGEAKILLEGISSLA